MANFKGLKTTEFSQRETNSSCFSIVTVNE